LEVFQKLKKAGFDLSKDLQKKALKVQSEVSTRFYSLLSKQGALEANDIQTIRDYIKCGFDVNTMRDLCGDTLLIKIAREGAEGLEGVKGLFTAADYQKALEIARQQAEKYPTARNDYAPIIKSLEAAAGAAAATQELREEIKKAMGSEYGKPSASQ
jgi:hypothetical protein